ncbi:MAG: formylglycine-generating enzyme family protein, partial [Pirellula sp.]
VAGLFDIHGNLWEWTDDWYGKSSIRVLRGGSWDVGAAFCRSADRGRNDPSVRNYDHGFRVALSPSGIPQSPEADK